MSAMIPTAIRGERDRLIAILALIRIRREQDRLADAMARLTEQHDCLERAIARYERCGR